MSVPARWSGSASCSPLPAIWLVSREPATDAPRGHGPGVLDGVLAGLGFGTLFAALAQIPEEAGLPAARAQPARRRRRDRRASPWRCARPGCRATAGALGGVVSGALGALATGLFLVATHHGYLSVAAVITSLYPAFTVLLAATVLREHVHRTQAIGLALCGGAVVLVAAG